MVRDESRVAAGRPDLAGPDPVTQHKAELIPFKDSFRLARMISPFLQRPY